MFKLNDFAVMGNILPREESTLQLGLNEELSVESAGGRVEGCTRDRSVDVIGRSDGVAIEPISLGEL